MKKDHDNKIYFFAVRALVDLLDRIQRELKVRFRVAVETEFYIRGGSEENDCRMLASWIKEVSRCHFSPERGFRQFEIVTDIYDDCIQLVADYKLTISSLCKMMRKNGAAVDFRAASSLERPTSGMHVHFSALNLDGYNIFQKSNANFWNESDSMLFAIGGLLKTMPEAVIHCVPYPKDYRRFRRRDALDCQYSQMLFTPTHYSWGGNNRSCAIRIPDSSLKPDSRHIEYRLPTPRARLASVLWVVFAGFHYGLTHKILPSQIKVFGHAFDTRLGLQPLPCSRKEARLDALRSSILNSYD